MAGLAATFLGGAQALAVAGADEVPDGSLPFVAKVSFGDVGSCTGALVDSRWIVTAKACFFDGTTAVTAGPPSKPTTVVLGRADVTKVTGHRLSVVSLVPHPDRNIVLAELSAPVKDITPATLDGGAPQAGETLNIAGYGRTATEWVPDRMHAGTFTVGTVSSGAFAVDGTSGATLCKGDAGGPAFRNTASGPQLVGITDTSAQHGCLSEPAGTSEGSEARTDDLGDWIRTSTAVAPDGLLEPVTGDFNRDAYQDLIAKDAAGVLWLYPGTATPGVWGHRVKVGNGGWQPLRDFAVGRINRDDYDDLVTIDSNTNILWMYPGTASGGVFGARVQIGSGWTSDFRDVTIGKVDRDDYDDLLVVKASTQQLLIYKGTAAGGNFAAGVQYGTGWSCCTQLNIGKFNNDDYADLTTVDTTGKIRIYAGTAAGTNFAAGVDIGAGSTWLSSSYLVPAKLDNSGMDGLIAVDKTTGATSLHPRTSSGGWATAAAPGGKVYTPQPYDLTNLVTGEFNRDAYTDLLGVDSGGVLWLYPGTAGGVYGPRVKVGNAGWQALRDFAVGRINRDNYDDLVVIETATGILWMYPGTAAGGTFGTRVQIGSSWTSDFRDVTIGKVDRDAYDDLLVVKASTQQLLLYKGTAAGGNFAAGVQYGTGWACCTQLNLGKFNNDDYDDLTTVDTTGKIRIYAGTADGTQFAPGVDIGAGTGWTGRTDLFPIGHSGLMAKDPTTGALLTYPMDANGQINWADPIPYGPRD